MNIIICHLQHSQFEPGPAETSHRLVQQRRISHAHSQPYEETKPQSNQSIKTELQNCNSVEYITHQRPEVHVCGSSHHNAHLWPAWVLSVVEIIVINAEKRVQVKGSKIPQAQCLEVIYLLHQACG